MEYKKRLSVNTSLMNARIFDDDAWDEHNQPIKPPAQQVDDTQTLFKQEPPESDEDDTFQEDCNPIVKKIKEELKDESLEEGELEKSMIVPGSSVKFESPSKIKLEPNSSIDQIFSESPYNKEIFKTLKIKEETPIKTDQSPPQTESYSRSNLKSAKRTVFSRLSPYKRQDNLTSERKSTVKSRLGLKINEGDVQERHPRKNPKKVFEADPAVIARREKQIEYGKNTIGYENYVKMVKKSERKPDDPQTPPKFEKYSRRGWEGLIKQWRIKLHKYDPPEEKP